MADSEQTHDRVYTPLVRRRCLILMGLLLFFLLAFLVDVTTGSSHMTVGEALQALVRPGTVSSRDHTIIWTFRLPMAAMAVLVGMALSLAGVGMQTILGNPLASPFTLGVSASAGFGAALAMTGYALLPFAGVDVAVNAFVLSFTCTAMVFGLARAKSGSSHALILAGIAMMFLFNSLLAVVEYSASEHELQSIVFWLFGNLNRATWPKVAMLGAAVAVVLPVMVADAWRLSALRLGDHAAWSLGVNVRMLRLRTIVLCSVLTSFAVCFVGTIAFVGMVAPHVARMLVGDDQRFLLPCSALIGGGLLSTAAIAGEWAVPTTVFPIGVATSLIGAPFFIFLILRGRHV